mgnify:CR=1 FL=1
MFGGEKASLWYDKACVQHICPPLAKTLYTPLSSRSLMRKEKSSTKANVWRGKSLIMATMALILNGNLETGAHVWREIGN